MYKFERLKLKIKKTDDKRVKLTAEQKAEIKNSAGISIAELARMYNVSRRTIQFILFPERQVENLRLRKLNGGSKQYYNTDSNREYMRIHRSHKRELFNKGKLD